MFVPITTRLASLQHRVIACRRTCSSLFALAYCMALQAWSVEYVPAPNKPLLVCSNVCASRFAVIAALYCCLACGIQLVRPSCPTTCWSKYSGCLEVSPTLCHGWRVSVTCPCRFARPKLTEQPLARSQVEVSERATTCGVFKAVLVLTYRASALQVGLEPPHPEADCPSRNFPNKGNSWVLAHISPN